MATAICAIMTPLPTTSQQQQTRPAAPLRRATYVHVSDLTSAYNIDHARLEQELARVKATRDASTEDNPPTITDADDEATQTADIDAAMVNLPQKRLQPPRGGYNLCVLVGRVNVVVDKRRVDGSRVRLAEVEIGDETGTVSLRARDEQIDVLEDVSKRSGAVVLRNCTLELYQGKHIRLAVTKWGKLSTYPDSVASTPPPPSKMNSDRNFSLIDLSVVASEMVDPNPEPAYNPRTAPKTPESSEGGSSSGRQSGGKQGGQSHRQAQFQQSQSSSRRGSRGGDRRQARSKQAGGGGNPPQSHYTSAGVTSSESGTMQQPPHGQMRFQGMHGFSPGYDQPMDVRQYSYPHGRQPQASAQQLMLHQQYEMQQRQLQQMYHDQHERHRTMRQGHQMHSTMLLPSVIGAGSFDAPGEYPPSYPGSASEQHQSVMAVVGSNPVLVPMPMSGGRASAASAPSSREQYGVSHGGHAMMPSVASMEGGRHGIQQGKDTPQQAQHHHHLQSADTSFASMDRERQSQPMSLPPLHSQTTRIDSPFSAGKMNPQASVFAPSYMNPTGTHQSTHQVYFPFDPSQAGLYGQGSEPPPSVYGPSTGVMYVQSAGGSSKSSTGTGETSRDAPAPGGTSSSEAVGDSPASGKENLQSGP